MHPSKPSRASSTASVDTQTTGNNAALLGATRAFGRPKPITSSRTGDNGASAAASTAGAARATTATGTTMNIPDRSYSRSPLPLPGSSADSMSSDIMRKAPPLDLVNMPHLSIPHSGGRPQHVRSPSQQAAVLAATRAHPPPAAPKNEAVNRSRGVPSARPAIALKPRRLSEHIRKIAETKDISDRPTDTTPIAPTTSLVDLFEQKLKESQQPEEDRPEPILIEPHDGLSIRSPKPVMPPKSGITSMIQLQYTGNQDGKPALQRRASVKRDSAVAAQQDGHASSSGEYFLTASEDLDVQFPVGSSTASTSQRVTTQSLSKDCTHADKLPPTPPSPARRSATKPIQIQTQLTRRRPSVAPSESMSVNSAKSARSIPAQYHQAYPRRMTPQMSGDQLANAIVASSLASSRAPSPMRLEPLPVPGRQAKHHYHHHHKLAFSRTPSPAKGGMLHTLRKAEDSSSDSEDDPHPYAKHKKKRLVRKHPNKHHEGDRKRWRDAVTDRERKRYEGVWAANKGMHWSYTLEEEQFFSMAPQHPRAIQAHAAANDSVSNIVVRDIWSRSRLSEQTLEMVWDLVDNDAVGRLQKDEFVVGMWLIDQRLKGRKLPVKVSETVWASVRGISGIKVRK
ncbi:hypothetical protein DOTSEDRAFT_69932 [Dothistroma septosporum NZE10]|uniref:EH domain-containing protein n=1 Tax=Dothistroma septosporum (strain NZE10 / CBS 128990) TaxID=675120 RepID=N1PXM0_DOTSN|nr:hypothetical protein DOTSEDRAFT_69932 [Dothistroma septosporum NZE10]